jgi:hypothetical protein
MTKFNAFTAFSPASSIFRTSQKRLVLKFPKLMRSESSSKARDFRIFAIMSGVIVADAAVIPIVLGIYNRRSPSVPYTSRKLEPHFVIQWASSIMIARIFSLKAGEVTRGRSNVVERSCSGDVTITCCFSRPYVSCSVTVKKRKDSFTNFEKMRIIEFGGMVDRDSFETPFSVCRRLNHPAKTRRVRMQSL